MSNLKLCQGPECHMKKTQDRLRGTKPNKTYQTRRRSSFYYGGSNFCSLNCQNDWFQKFGTQAINHFGRLTEAKHLTEQNAWTKDYSWDNAYNVRSYVYRNGITNEQRPLTKEQYRDDNYNINVGE